MYQSLRITYEEPIIYIVHQLKSLAAIKAADIGCGTGRYTQLLFRRSAEPEKRSAAQRRIKENAHGL